MPMPKNQVTLICKNCGNPFSVKASVAKKGRRFCSWECRKQKAQQSRITVSCAHCGTPIETYKANPQKYCSYTCGITARNLTDKNPSYHRDISGNKNPMYGKGQHGADNPMYGKTREQNPAWKGGRKVRKDGYILAIAPDDHPYPISNGKRKTTKYILEHRLVMERHIGRYLEPHEVIHHIDGNPSNNSIDNLRLYGSQSDHIKDAHPDVLNK